MRQFDLWNRYKDNNGNPLHGAVQFNVKDGNTPAPIFSRDGTALNNPILTDIYGRTAQQVFIKADVTAYFYKYIGPGSFENLPANGINVNDPELWALQFSCDNVFSGEQHIVTDSAPNIGTIAELRSTDVDTVGETDGEKVITLLGYNEIGDKEPINYIWDAESQVNDNGGSVIKNDDLITGRWIMVQPTEHCDSRHFGVFPQDSSNSEDQSYGITKLFEYCLEKDIRPFFNGSEDFRWFKYHDINVQATVIDVTDSTRFNDSGSNQITGDWNGNPKFVNRATSLTAKFIKTSWNALSFTGYDKVIIDAFTPQLNFENAEVYVNVDVTNKRFVNCKIHSDEHIGSGCEVVECDITGQMFNASFDADGHVYDCRYDIDDFKGKMDLYKVIRCSTDSNPFFDYRNYVNVGMPYAVCDANKIVNDSIFVDNLKNALDTLVEFEQIPSVQTITLEDSTGYYAAPTGTVLHLKSCVAKVKLTDGVTLIAEDSTIDLDESVPEVLPTISLRNCTLTGPGSYRLANFSAYDSTVATLITAQNTFLKGCQINSNYTLIPKAGVAHTATYMGESVTVDQFITGYIDSNIFNAKLIIDGQDTTADHVLVDGLVIKDNRSNAESINAWEIKRKGVMNSDRQNTYSFTGNTGGFVCKMTLNHVPVERLNYPSANGNLCAAQDDRIDMYNLNVGVMQLGVNISTDPENPVYADDFSKYFTKMRMFVIGQYDAEVDIEFSVLEYPVDDTDNIKIQPNTPYFIGGTDAKVDFLVGPSVVRAHLSTDAKYTNGHTGNIIVPDLGKEPGQTEEWQIRNFNIGRMGRGLMSSYSYALRLGIRQLDKD